MFGNKNEVCGIYDSFPGRLKYYLKHEHKLQLQVHAENLAVILSVYFLI